MNAFAFYVQHARYGPKKIFFSFKFIQHSNFVFHTELLLKYLCLSAKNIGEIIPTR